MLQPKKSKYLKQHRDKFQRFATSGTAVSFGVYGFKAVEFGCVTASQIEAVRRIISRNIKNVGKYWIRIFPDKAITKKPLEVRQGKGCGSVDRWVAVVDKGKVLFELSGVSSSVARGIHKVIASKLSVKTIFCERLSV